MLRSQSECPHLVEKALRAWSCRVPGIGAGLVGGRFVPWGFSPHAAATFLTAPSEPPLPSQFHLQLPHSSPVFPPRNLPHSPITFPSAHSSLSPHNSSLSSHSSIFPSQPHLFDLPLWPHSSLTSPIFPSCLTSLPSQLHDCHFPSQPCSPLTTFSSFSPFTPLLDSPHSPTSAVFPHAPLSPQPHLCNLPSLSPHGPILPHHEPHFPLTPHLSSPHNFLLSHLTTTPSLSSWPCSPLTAPSLPSSLVALLFPLSPHSSVFLSLPHSPLTAPFFPHGPILPSQPSLHFPS